MHSAVTIIIALVIVLPLACSSQRNQLQANAQAARPAGTFSSTIPEADGIKISGSPGKLPLSTLRDVPLSGGATRFDYQSFDPNTGRLYIAHLGDGACVIGPNIARIVSACFCQEKADSRHSRKTWSV